MSRDANVHHFVSINTNPRFSPQNLVCIPGKSQIVKITTARADRR